MDITKYTKILPTLDQVQNGFASLTDKGMQFEKAGSGILIGILAVSVLVCILGLNIRKLWTILASFLIGLGAGYYAGLSFGTETVVALGIGAAAGIILAVLVIFQNAAGVFLMCLLLAAYTGFLTVPSGQTMKAVICLGIAVVIALISIKLKDPMTIVCTVAAGSITGGLAAMPLFDLKVGYYQYIISAALAVIGLISQILYASRKVAKQDIKKAKEIKAEQSVENEIEAARAILDEDETETEEIVLEENAEQELADESVISAQAEPELEEITDEDFEEYDFAEEEDFPKEIVMDDEPEETEESLSPEEEAARAKRELEEARKELERMKKELEEAKREK